MADARAVSPAHAADDATPFRRLYAARVAPIRHELTDCLTYIVSTEILSDWNLFNLFHVPLSVPHCRRRPPRFPNPPRAHGSFGYYRYCYLYCLYQAIIDSIH